MPLTFDDNTATISTSEYSLPNNSTSLTPQTDVCVLQAWIDFAALGNGDEYLVKIYEKVDGGTQRSVSFPILGAQSSPFVSPAFTLGDGWDVTVKKVSGTDRSIRWSLRKVHE